VEQTPEENMATFPSVSGGYVSIPFYSRLSKIGMGKQYIWHDSTSLKKKKAYLCNMELLQGNV
jgi:hypothetical protein